MTNLRDKLATVPDSARISILWDQGAAEYICDAGEVKALVGEMASNSPQEATGGDVGSAAGDTVDESPVGVHSPTRFKVGNRLRNVYWQFDYPPAIVTELTAKGFRYEHESRDLTPWHSTTGGESFVDEHWVKVEDD